ncbi:MAG: peptidylprolyl isomerase [Candidatus Rokubacteria bacterium]|nr:peptidylprolyl isomerase [Candidatus Rokubacteria bacterium]
MKTLGVLLLAATAVAPAVSSARAEETPPVPGVGAGSRVSLEYTLSDDDGKVLASNKGGPPLTYRQGAHEIIPGLEKALDGMHAGDAKTVTIEPADGYGHVDPTAVTEVPKEMIPPDALTVGTELVARGPGGGMRVVRVKEIKDTTVVIDLNHPLAGKTLHFDVKILDVEAPTD